MTILRVLLDLPELLSLREASLVALVAGRLSFIVVCRTGLVPWNSVFIRILPQRLLLIICTIMIRRIWLTEVFLFAVGPSSLHLFDERREASSGLVAVVSRAFGGHVAGYPVLRDALMRLGGVEAFESVVSVLHVEVAEGLVGVHGALWGRQK